MNTRPILDSGAGPFVLSVAFNQDNSCFTAALESGYRVITSGTCTQKAARHFGGGIGYAQPLGTTQFVALVGGGRQPKFPQNKVQIWDESKGKVYIACEVQTPVQRVRISKSFFIIAELNKVGIHKLKFPPEKLAHYETVNNPHGICELGTNIVAFPGRTLGQVKVFDLKTGNISIIPAHESPLRAVAISKNEDFIATASEQGTIIRLWSFPSCTKLAEFRRGVDQAAIFSLAFSPSGTTLAVTSDKGTLHIYDLPAITNAQNQDPSQHKYGILSKLPMLPRQFSDTYPTASIKFEMGDEPTQFGPHTKAPTLSTAIPGVPGGRPTKGLLGWLDDNTIIIIGAGQDSRWDRFSIALQEGTGKRVLVTNGWRRYLDD